MAALATSHRPIHLDHQIPNDYPMHMFTRDGVAHDLDHDGWYTRCGLRIDHGHQVTLAQVLVWCEHRFCLTCFTGVAT